MWRISLAALGIVFGDIGTSPLYAFRECFVTGHGATPTAENLIGAASLIIWSLILIVSVKYVTLVLKLDNKGEGGILALAALIRGSRLAEGLRDKKWIFVAGMLGAALIYADGMITPAISVLSAVEGITVARPELREFVIPLAMAIIFLLFKIQHFGTRLVGKLFGPVILLWFLVLGCIGLVWVIRYPEVLAAINPLKGVMFLIREKEHALVILAAVFLSVTGGEALYADLGHFSARSIKLAWNVVVLPGLALNYLGQAALVSHQADVSHSFYNLVHPVLVLPLTLLATCAAIIASQALISGAYSLTSQAMLLGCIPRMRLLYTSQTEKGHVYLPSVNWFLMISCMFLIYYYRSSSNLAAAYGIAISLTMIVTTILLYQASRSVWKWSNTRAFTVTVLFFAVDGGFLVANGLKVMQGGWFPLLIASVIIFIMATWRWGRERLSIRMEKQLLPAQMLIDDLEKKNVHRVSGTGFYLCGKTGGIPLALLHNLKHNQVLHERVILLHVETLDSSHSSPEERCDISSLGMGFYLMHLRFGFAESPNVPNALREHLTGDVRYEPNKSTFFLGRETYAFGKNIPAWGRFRIAIFAWMTRNATPATAYFSLPPSRVVELGAQVTL